MVVEVKLNLISFYNSNNRPQYRAAKRPEIVFNSIGKSARNFFRFVELCRASTMKSLRVFGWSMEDLHLFYFESVVDYGPLHK